MIKVYGCLLSPTDLRDYKLNKLSICKTTFPESFSSIDNHVIKNQGAVCSCTAHAVASILESFDKNRCTLSTNFIYGIRNRLYNDTGRGQTIRCALKIAKDYGTMQKYLCPGNNEVDNVFSIASEAFDDPEKMEDAYKHKISKYVKLNSEKDIKFALMNYGPIVACIRWSSNNTFNKSTSIMTFNYDSGFSYHAIMIYGWNGDCWLCQNSWGSSWGNNGLFKLHMYDDCIKEAYALIDDKSLDSSSNYIIIPSKTNITEHILKFLNGIINWFKEWLK